MTTATDRADVLIEVPTEDTLRILREQQLLPASGKEIPWTKADARPLPSFAALAQVDPKHTFKSGHFGLSISNAESFYTNEVSGTLNLRSRACAFTALFLAFSGLGANRKILAYFDIQVFGPANNSITIGGTGPGFVGQPGLVRFLQPRGQPGSGLLDRAPGQPTRSHHLPVGRQRKPDRNHHQPPEHRWAADLDTDVLAVRVRRTGRCLRHADPAGRWGRLVRHMALRVLNSRQVPSRTDAGARGMLPVTNPRHAPRAPAPC